MITLHDSELTWLADRELVASLSSAGRCSSLLVLCRGDNEGVLRSLVPWCAAPVHVIRLPGALTLPARRTGTVVLSDVSALDLGQQIQLQDWLTFGRGDVPMVSITSVPLWPLVAEGRFLEGLYYRLNVVTLEATATPR